MGKVDIKTTVMLFIGVFVLFTVVNAIFSTTNTAVTTLNETMNTAGYTTEGNLVVTGFQVLILVLGLGAVILGAKTIMEHANKL